MFSIDCDHRFSRNDSSCSKSERELFASEQCWSSSGSSQLLFGNLWVLLAYPAADLV